MIDLYRFGISLEKSLIQAFDIHIKKKKYANRSEAIRDLIRDELARKTWNEGGVVSGAVVMTYDHHKRELVSEMLDIQHDFQELIIATQHVHLDHHLCLEIIAVKGEARKVEKLANLLKSHVGVKHVNFCFSSGGG